MKRSVLYVLALVVAMSVTAFGQWNYLNSFYGAGVSTQSSATSEVVRSGGSSWKLQVNGTAASNGLGVYLLDATFEKSFASTAVLPYGSVGIYPSVSGGDMIRMSVSFMNTQTGENFTINIDPNPLFNQWNMRNFSMGSMQSFDKIQIYLSVQSGSAASVQAKVYIDDFIINNTSGNYIVLENGGDVTGIHDENASPTGFALHQNYPNPFNPTTTINYSLSQAGPVDMRIYDVLGKEVAVLVMAEMAAGEHSVRFDASGLVSGTYVCRLRSGGIMQTKKLTLLK